MEDQHGSSVPQMREVEIWGGGVGTSNICDFIRSGSEDSDIPGIRLYIINP